ncbi:hypothetical protein CBM2592_A230076 [Cupriavidus taiwanensis]|nr:hypothetical protein CBM2588_A180227 [Cupriavidus taiwanensis]SOY50852.1 hypothetical protein CBM2592_A230076 [Cupriavidus taiwanensis]SOY83734.1 hypothetical protein CBM2591_A270086 [Cupriavidus taiwanensis]SOZ57970.1 hypothetical protein CBM2617_A260080 [Cupriavidus taiwanensis]SOZ79771.1 hypothetical protein CBM2618_A230084 [Cupriavidus taiwanensis]
MRRWYEIAWLLQPAVGCSDRPPLSGGHSSHLSFSFAGDSVRAIGVVFEFSASSLR